MIELEKYHAILTDDYPFFIHKYLSLTIMQKLKTRGQFCGADYTKLLHDLEMPVFSHCTLYVKGDYEK